MEDGGLFRRNCLMRILILLAGLFHGAEAREYQYAPAPVDNPLKGFVPYVESARNADFPCAMEFRYFALDELMKGWGRYDWTPLEATLEEVRGRGRQLCFRVYSEYPGKGNRVPGFLEDEGVKVVRWEGDNTYEATNYTPDYESPIFRKAMKEFIAALGEKYDGDERVGFVTIGLLGSWGEWHNYPRNDLWASKTVQSEVMDVYEEAFQKTKALLRYPAGKNDSVYESNSERSFGYHDDSFAWATLDTGKEEDGWYFVPKLKKAKAEDRWKRQPIGGELRPELWESSFTSKPHPKSQDFAKCVEETHVSWLMDSGLFKAGLSQEKRRNAEAAVRRMGYEIHLASAKVVDGQLVVEFENRGVAPFYYPWPVELLVGEEKVDPGWDLMKVSSMEGYQALTELPANWEGQPMRLRVKNPMENGRPLKFANKEQGDVWLELGEF